MAEARSLLRLARAHVGERYVLGAQVPKGNPEWRGPWDCAEFASWCVYQVAGVLFGCKPKRDANAADAYSGFWMDDARASGTVIPIAQAAATAGAFLVRAPTSGAVGHVVICAGGGRTVEAHSTKRGVIESSTDGRRWDIGVLVPGIDTTTPPAPEPPKRPGLVLRVKHPLMTGDLVRTVQQRLKKLGFHSGPTDGIYGRQTAAAVLAFQLSKGLLPDGEVGRTTARALKVDWY